MNEMAIVVAITSTILVAGNSVHGGVSREEKKAIGMRKPIVGLSEFERRRWEGNDHFESILPENPSKLLKSRQRRSDGKHIPSKYQRKTRFED